ncbi:MAG: fibronectin type III domain-containing protein, partial [bacterium]|nr:fibronectin type III domain-containing protein [bacterium]
AIWCAILALLPFLTFLTKFSGKLGILTKKIVAGKIGIINFQVSVVSENWAAVEWQTRTLSDSAAEFSFFPYSDAKYQAELVIDEKLTKEHRLVIKGLKSNTTYYLRVSSSDKFGNREQSGEISFQTPESEVAKKKSAVKI